MLYYKQKTKLSPDRNQGILDIMPKCQFGEEIWPRPSDLHGLEKSQLENLKITSLRIIQKNSSRSRGDEWGHAFYFQIRLD